MIDTGALSTGGKKGGGSGVGGGGGVSASWVDENYVSKDFFSALFKVFNGTGSSATEIEPNDDMPTPDTNVNIQAIYGVWTEKFLTALGYGAGSGGGGGATALSQLTDVLLTSLRNGDLLKYNGTHWVNVTLATLLTDYADKQWCNATFVTAASLSDNATQTWVNRQGFIKTHPTTIWGQNWPTSNSPINGDMTDVGDVTMDNNKSIYIKNNSNTAVKLLSLGSNNVFITGNGSYEAHIAGSKVLLHYGTNVGMTLDTNGYVGIGIASPQHKLHVVGGIYASTYITALSDIRKKNILKGFTLKVDDIALASLVRFTWKDGEDKSVHAGCIAQEWQKILPEAVVETEDGTLSLDYGVVATASAISLARKVQEQQKEIDDLKARLKKIEKLLNL